MSIEAVPNLFWCFRKHTKLKTTKSAKNLINLTLFGIIVFWVGKPLHRFGDVVFESYEDYPLIRDTLKVSELLLTVMAAYLVLRL